MSGLSRRRFLGLRAGQQPAPDPPARETAAPRTFLDDFYASRGRQAGAPLVFHPTVAEYRSEASPPSEEARNHTRAPAAEQDD